MIAELLKNIKQVALTHAMSTAMVVQGVAIQQVAVSDFSKQEENLSQIMSDQSQAALAEAQGSGLDESSYWQDIESLAEAAELPARNAEALDAVRKLYEPESNSQSSEGESKNGSAPLVASNFGVTAVSAPAISGRAPASSKRPSVVSKNSGASGGQNNISSEAVKNAIAAANSVSEVKAPGSTRPESTSRASSSGSSSSDSSALIDQSVGEQEGQDSNQQQEQDDSEQEEESFTYLGQVYLIKDGSEQVQLVNDQDTLVLDEDAEYTLVVETSEDFGSVNFNLENRDTNSTHQGQENHLPFALNGDVSGHNGGLNAFDFEEASYQLDLRAYDGNGQGGDVLETRTIRFSVTFSD